MIPILILILYIVLVLFITLFLSLISKYYREKSGGGPRPLYFVVYSIVFVLGQVLRIEYFQSLLGTSISGFCMIVGGVGLISSSFILYRSMMKVEKG